MLYRLVGYLPFWLLYALAHLGYLLLYHVARYRREVVADNLAHAFPEKNAAERKRLEKAFYLRLCQVALEVLRARTMRLEEFAARVKVTNGELVERLSEGRTRSIIVLTIHQGNWEWMLHGNTAALGISMDPVYKPLHDAAADEVMLETRNRFGSRPLAMADAARDILRRRREFRLFVMVADQSPTGDERGYWTQFFHRDARFYLGAESIAQATGFPVVFAQCRRLSTGHYEMIYREVAEPPYEKGSHAITERYIEIAEEAIRAEPESWLWSNRRWKRARPADA
ncbi:lipid A biosynthesis (KDO)2-(lauroyl)-lipid IVA acyltransferase [Mangrovimicrobium sediminis]|uniref:Lipid A biosynthesis (KDO)2-(Lauroyl)-lipid IVA acyltransferase n=1 Tax=Mangrovimicrobium sediminis TaxID=2562682 RepID=A0A4Z0LY55_9GAMM|nr:lysophospholipid acyltransferase family protein [Haliea sp. SAOS-164]TGD72078.1 lipid A biosynthesis (KDO)2-(lauroyl)-lipid IVA acyltransferase [Haliea sp. SAOS-164]